MYALRYIPEIVNVVALVVRIIIAFQIITAKRVVLHIVATA